MNLLDPPFAQEMVSFAADAVTLICFALISIAALLVCCMCLFGLALLLGVGR
ncbi:MAG: hypothetical protein ACREHV_11620 [Rhizomicrobium sp.]